MCKVLNYWVVAGCRKENISPNEKIEKLVNRVAKKFNVSVESITKSRKQRRELAQPRQIIMYILHKEYGFTQQKAGSVVNRSHCNCLYACTQVKNFMDIEKDFNILVNNLI